MNHPLRCRCGTLRGRVRLPATTGRAICYCKDCQAYAHFLQRADDVLDEAGGTDIVAMAPAQLQIEQGLDHLACMSLSKRGILRWYASCCNTPIGNTPRDRKVHYVGLVHNCLSAQPMDASFGPARVRLNTESARSRVASTPAALVSVMFTLMRVLLPAGFGGRYRNNPFFTADGSPLRVPQVPAAAELVRLKEQVAGAGAAH
jgi:hypothetical protein